MIAYTTLLHSDEVHENRQHWLDKRRNGIGSSDAATILGVNPWSSLLSVYADKLNLDMLDEEQSEAAYWGQRLEPIVLEELAKETGRDVSPWGALLQSTERDWQIATCDGYQMRADYTPGVVEIKCTRLYHNWDEGVPAYVYAQVQHQLAVTGYTFASVAVLFQGYQFKWVDVERNDEFIGELCQREEAFWQRVVSLDPPSPDSTAYSSAALARLYPESNGQTIELPGEYLNLDDTRQDLVAEIAGLEKRKRALDNRLKAAIGEHEAGLLRNGITYTLKADKNGRRSLRRKTAA